jgi:hypothetical protein
MAVKPQKRSRLKPVISPTLIWRGLIAVWRPLSKFMEALNFLGAPAFHHGAIYIQTKIMFEMQLAFHAVYIKH